MDKARKKNIKRIITAVCILLVVALLAAMPLIARQEPEADGPQASILSGKVSLGSIQTELIGGGQLAEEEVVAVSVPSAVKLKKFLVENGQTVTAGTALASVDRVTVMTAISQVQETLEHLSEQIEKAGDTVSEETVTALAGGTVKILYAQAGDSVQNVMLEHGALAVLSLDGLMAVDMESTSALSAGTEVTVTLADGSTAVGKIVKNLLGEMTVTLEDHNYAVGEAVKVTDTDGEELGSGSLYIYSPWNATAYAGTVKTVKVKEGDTISAGKALMELSDVGYSAAYRQLIGQRQEYEQLMLILFEMYQTETVTAPCDGVVTGIEKNSAQLLSAESGLIGLQLLANSPNGDDDALYSNYVGKIALVAKNGWAMDVNPQLVPIADYRDLSEISLDDRLMTETVLHTFTDLPVFTLEQDAWVLVDRQTLRAGDILLFAADAEGNLVWSVLLQKAEEEEPKEPGGSETPGGNEQPGDSETPGGNEQPGGNTGGNTGSFPSGGMTGGFPSGGTQQEDAFELYGLDMAQIATVTPQSTMTLEITVDEQDIKSLQMGMEAQVKLDALGGEKFTATIAEIGNTGTNNGGSSKYTLVLTMERAENMLPGMNATATIVLASTENVRTVPADALVEMGNETIVYTAYDEKEDVLLDPVVVKVGNSDGERVEILEGLSDDQTYYYAYYDTLEISNTPDFGGGFMFG